MFRQYGGWLLCVGDVFLKEIPTRLSPVCCSNSIWPFSASFWRIALEMTKSQSSQNNESNSVSFTFQEKFSSSKEREKGEIEREGVVELHDGGVSFDSNSNYVKVATVSDEAYLSSPYSNNCNFTSRPIFLKDNIVYFDKPQSKETTICTPTDGNSWKSNYVISDSVDFSTPQTNPQLSNDSSSDMKIFKQLLSIGVKIVKEKLGKLDIISFLLGTLLSLGATRIPKKLWFLIGKWTLCLLLVYMLWDGGQKARRSLSWLLKNCLIPFFR